METTITQMQRLEKCILTSQMSIDKIFSTTISKLYSREIKRANQLISRLQAQINEFENQYTMNSKEFVEKFDKGSLGDEIDYVEWSSTLEMLENVKKRKNIL